MAGGTRVVVVTGASAGLGRATVRAFAKEGCHIGLIARGDGGLEAAKREVESLGGRAIVCRCDVSDYSQVNEAAKAIADEFGRIDVWVNNAMTTVMSPVRQTLPDEFRRVTEVNYLGYVHGTLAALKHMESHDKGLIIQVGSALAYRSIPLQGAYCASKHAIMGFTESLRVELLRERSGVQVCMIEMPALNTPQFSWGKTRLKKHPQPVPPVFQPEVGADAIVWLSHHPRREMYVGFPTVKAIWADKVIPNLADHYLARFGYDAQQADIPFDPNRPNNLWEPVEGDFGARGVFDEVAKTSSPQVWLSKHKMAAGSLGALGILSFALMRMLKTSA